MKKILIIQTAFIGDVILATAVAEKLHKFYPEARIDFLLRKGNESLLEGHPFLNEIIIWDKKDKKLSNLFDTIRKVRKNKYDLLINVHRFASSGLISFFSKSKIKAGFDKNPFSFCYDIRIRHSTVDNLHEVQRNLLLIEKFTDPVFEMPRLYPLPEDVKNINEYIFSNNLKLPYITVSPTSVWFTKQFPEHQWIRLIRKQNPEFPVFLLGASNDFKACERIRKELEDRKVVTLAGKLSLLQSAALMQSAEMNFTNDSAPMHIASAMNAPVTAVFCSTVPAFGFGPLSDQRSVIELDSPLSCRPCGLHGYKACPLGHFKCAEEILV